MIADPNATPITNATCCFHGVAPTSWPVLRSCRLSLEMVATPKVMAAANSVNATSAVDCPLSARPKTTLINTAAMRTVRMPTPEIGLFDEPISPAMYPHTDAMTRPMTKMNTRLAAMIPAEAPAAQCRD